MPTCRWSLRRNSPAAERVLSFHCSFTHPFRSWCEITTTQKVISMNDFVLPASEAEATFTVRHFAPNGQAMVDHSSVCIAHDEVHRTFHCSQQTEMVRRFGEVVRNAEGAARLRWLWRVEARLTQAVIDACMQSLGNGGKEVPVKHVSLAFP